jgi:hypothetical protein
MNMLAKIAAAPVLAGTIGAAIAASPAEAETPGEPTSEGNALYDEAFKDGYDDGHSNALTAIALIWMERWKAAGGFYSRSYNRDGSARGFHIGWQCYGWAPEDYRTSKLPPHLCLYEESHQDGALRVLQAMLELCPELEQRVLSIGEALRSAQGA